MPESTVYPDQDSQTIRLMILHSSITDFVH